MTIRRWSDALVTVTVVLSISSYALADRFPALAIGAVPITLLGWCVADVLGKAIARRPVSDVLVLAAIGWSAYRVRDAGGLHGLTVSVFCEFLIAIIVVKMWDRKQSRDTAQILTLSVFLSVGSMLTGASLGMAAILLTNLLALLMAVTAFHIAAGYELVGSPERSDGPRVGLGPHAKRQFIGTLTLAMAMGLVVSGVIFLVMPRGIGFGLAGAFGQPTGGRVTGLADHVDLRQSGLISESARVVLEARFKDKDQNSLGADGRVFYLRASVLDAYNRGAWSAANRDETRSEDSPPGNRFSLGGSPGANGIWQEIAMRDVAGIAPLPLVYRPVEIASDVPSTFSIRSTTDTVSRKGAAGPFKYIAASAPPELPPADERTVGGKDRSTETFGVARVRQIAAQVLRDADIDPDPRSRPPEQDFEACRALERYLRTTFTYTLNAGAPRAGTDPIEWFLTEGREGHCEYFASAMAGMCRSVGIKARVIAGYAAGEYDQSRDVYIVRESNAHAWVEARVSSRVWWTFDPTPPDTLRARLRPPTGLGAHWAAMLDRIDTFWSTSFISFDESSRRKLLGFSADPEPWLHAKLDALRLQYDEEGWRGTVPIIIKAAVAIVVGSIVAIALLRLSRGLTSRLSASLRRRSALRADPELARALGHTEFFRRMLALLRKRGYPKPSWQPPLAHAADVAARDPRLGEAATLAADLYYRARFGRQTPGEDELRAVHRALDEASRF